MLQNRARSAAPYFSFSRARGHGVDDGLGVVGGWRLHRYSVGESGGKGEWRWMIEDFFRIVERQERFFFSAFCCCYFLHRGIVCFSNSCVLLLCYLLAKRGGTKEGGLVLFGLLGTAKFETKKEKGGRRSRSRGGGRLPSAELAVFLLSPPPSSLPHSVAFSRSRSLLSLGWLVLFQKERRRCSSCCWGLCKKLWKKRSFFPFRRKRRGVLSAKLFFESPFPFFSTRGLQPLWLIVSASSRSAWDASKRRSLLGLNWGVFDSGEGVSGGACVWKDEC